MQNYREGVLGFCVQVVPSLFWVRYLSEHWPHFKHWCKFNHLPSVSDRLGPRNQAHPESFCLFPCSLQFRYGNVWAPSRGTECGSHPMTNVDLTSESSIGQCTQWETIYMFFTVICLILKECSNTTGCILSEKDPDLLRGQKHTAHFIFAGNVT